MQKMWSIATCTVAAGLGLACDDNRTCPAADQLRVDELPEKLSDTGLFADIARDQLAPGVLPYRPQFELWSDGAAKRRWMLLPPGTQIDTRDMDSWVFPAGTKFWKEFTHDGVRVETRLFEKRGDGEDDWVGVAYLWDADQRDATEIPLGARDALGTPHDVPAAGDCLACHGGRHSRILGFSAIQLSLTASPGDIDLDGAITAGLVSTPPAGRIVVPGDATERAALGYLHANCSHCHNADRPDAAPCFDPPPKINFFLAVDQLRAPGDTAAYRTAVHRCFEPGDPGASRMIDLVSHRGDDQMPPLATEQVDDRAVALLRGWIGGMPRDR